MAYPAYNARYYTGAAQAVNLDQKLVAGATIIYTTTLSGMGWDHLVQTQTLFTIVVDNGLATEEKILCSDLSTTGNSITVWQATDGSGMTGRGYDGTSNIEHAVSSSAVGLVFPIFSAIEAQEANNAVVAISQIAPNTGTSVTPANVSPTASSAGSSKYAAAYDHAHKLDSTTLNNLLGRAYISVTRNTTWSISGASGTGTALTWNSVQFAGQGITSGALDTSTGYITVPIAGIWRVSGAVQFQNGNGNSGILLQTVSGATRTTVASGSLVPDASANKGSVVSTLLSLTAGQVVCAALVSTGGTPATAYSYDATRHYLTLEFVSVA